MKSAFLTAVLILLTLPVAHADDCADAQDQATMNECVDRSYKAADAELNALYREIEQRLGDDAEARRLLLAAERTWLGFRDAECSFSSSGATGGSIYPMIHTMCLDTLTRSRVEDFRRYLSCEEGDMSCPVPPAN